MKNSYTILAETQRGRDHLENLGIEGRMGIKSIINETCYEIMG
jgi:hypothetical protein